MTKYRFTYSSTFQNELCTFAQIHRFDDKNTFKQSWKSWIQEHQELMDLEIQRLQRNGYQGDITNKMYKSVRYYYGCAKKNNKKTRPTTYICISKTYHTAVDDHLQSIRKCKPEKAFQLFLQDEKYKDIFEQEKKKIQNCGITNDSNILCKLKKTYKNRYYKK